MKIRWRGRPQESPVFGALVRGEEYDVPAHTAQAWIASGVAEQAREKKTRREAAPESASSQE